MQTVNDFYKLRDTEDFFNFFGLEFDQKLINIKRFHMMKEYGTLIKKGLNSISDENIWAILTTHLPKLKSEIQKFLK